MESSPPVSSTIRFGVFEVDLRSGELRKQGVRVKLQDRPFRTLQILLECAGEVVTREELRRRLWPSDTFVDFDHGLNSAVKKVRAALGDSADNPRFIETLAKRGYRFVAPVKELATRTGVSADPTMGDSIAVLPFASMSADPDDEFFADGMTEEIINALAQIDHLHVVARTSAFSFKGKYIDVRVIGKLLNVRTVLLGSVRRADYRLRITAQLVNVEDGYHLWSQRYDRELKDIFEIQDEIARSIAERLKVTLQGGRQDRLVKAGTKNLEAYSMYVKGRDLLPRRGPVVAYLDCFERAVSLDPNYAQAWAGVADSYSVLGYSGLAHPEASSRKP
jgi:TolB-like protein